MSNTTWSYYTKDRDVYLCLCDDDKFIAHEGPRYDLPEEVIEIWDREGNRFTREVVWNKVDIR